MPFKSEAQRRLFILLVDHKKMSPETLAKWERHTPKGDLPERLSMDKKAAARSAFLAGVAAAFARAGATPDQADRLCKVAAAKLADSLLGELGGWAVPLGLAGTVGLPFLAGSAVGHAAGTARDEMDQDALRDEATAAAAREYRRRAAALKLDVPPPDPAAGEVALPVPPARGLA